ncbi:MAG: helix-turn-helix domain-containing protein, partial [Bifidobacterium sp.]|uniref:helix-turn-helix domain-containing protein n=1 Tax=Bifidobacterium sp. TaxID=41200 RepID=UPI0039EA6590
MSLEAMNWVLRELPKQIEPSSFKVLIYMADCVDSDGKGFYKSHDTLAEETGLSKSTIKTHLRKLVDAGYIRRGDQRLAWHLHHRPTVYELCLPSNNRSSRESDSDPQPTADASGTSRIERDGRGSGGGQHGV